jgi:hypothetical protein
MLIRSMSPVNSALTRRVEDLEGKINEITRRIDNVEEKVDGLVVGVGVLTGRVNALELELTCRIDRLIFIGMYKSIHHTLASCLTLYRSPPAPVNRHRDVLTLHLLILHLSYLAWHHWT